MFGPKATCEWCDTEFRREKSWQRFCKPKCRDDWNNHQKKLAAVEAAEERRERRLEVVNGDAGERKPLSEILEALKLKSESIKRRTWG